MDEKSFLAETEAYIDKSTQLMKSFRAQSGVITRMAKALDEARLKGANIYVMGNGGSASTASHMANDMNKTACMNTEKKFRVISLTDNVPVVLAWANDESYDSIFIEQLMGFLNKGDVVIGISGSGNSPMCSGQ
jgi:D-sedoheptulose 7-phosphate isomerase